MKFARLMILLASSIFFIAGCSSNKDAKEGDLVSDQDMLQTGNSQFEAGNYQDAIHTYKSLMLNHPTSDLHIQTQLQIAAAYGRLEDYESQMDALLTLLKENIIPGEVPQIYFQIGQFYENAAGFNPRTVTSDTSDYKIAIDYYTKSYTYKDSEDQASKAAAAYRRALVEARIGAINDAITDYKIVQQFFPESDYAVLAGIKLRDPSDTSELPNDAESIEALRAEMNLPKAPVEQATEQPIELRNDNASQNIESYDVDDSVFQGSDTDSTRMEPVMEESVPDSSTVQ